MRLVIAAAGDVLADGSILGLGREGVWTLLMGSISGSAHVKL